MHIFTKEKLARAYFIGSMVLAKLSVLVVLGFIGFEAYVRWSLNQNFTFLGGWELEALTLSAFGLIFGLNYLNRAHKE